MHREIKFEFKIKTKAETLKRIYTLEEIARSKEVFMLLSNSEIMYSRQFSGIKDLNGNEIYEGDIVIPAKFKDIPNIVEYIGSGFYRTKKHGDRKYFNQLGSCQVLKIGDIFEGITDQKQN